MGFRSRQEKSEAHWESTTGRAPATDDPLAGEGLSMCARLDQRCDVERP